MAARGYPIEDFETRAADLSVDHPRVVENYRIARHLAQRRERREAEPRSAVEQADAFVAEMMTKLSETFSRERKALSLSLSSPRSLR